MAKFFFNIVVLSDGVANLPPQLLDKLLTKIMGGLAHSTGGHANSRGAVSIIRTVFRALHRETEFREQVGTHDPTLRQTRHSSRNQLVCPVATKCFFNRSRCWIRQSIGIHRLNLIPNFDANLSPLFGIDLTPMLVDQTMV